MSTKGVEQILAPKEAHMVGDGFQVHNFFPGGYKIGIHRMSPFFLLDYNARTELPPTTERRGVGVHPHRGFETVTVVFEGAVAHEDSNGGSGVINRGDVQWMTAASGVLHKEYQDESYSKKGGPFHMAQLWVNLPAKDKMSKPNYQPITEEQMGRFEFADGTGYASVIAGTFKGVKGPAKTFTPIEMYTLHLKKGADMSFDLPADFNTGLLIAAGEVLVNETSKAATDHFVLFKNAGETISLKAKEDSTVLVLSGKPIDEPIAAYGPFLMNNQEEIRQALDDYNQGKFGFLED